MACSRTGVGLALVSELIFLRSGVGSSRVEMEVGGMERPWHSYSRELRDGPCATVDVDELRPHFGPALLPAWTLMVKAPSSRHTVGIAQI